MSIMPRPRIFQIGFNKCATVSLTQFFISNGLRARHWDKGEIARKFYERKGMDQDPFADFPDADAFLDMNFLSSDISMEAGKDFQYIYRFYPNSYFILNTRNCADWLLSRSKHGDFLDRFKSAFGLKSGQDVLDYWRLDWYRHHANVLEFASKARMKLIVYDIDRDGPEKICDALRDDFAVTPHSFPHNNKTARPNSDE